MRIVEIGGNLWMAVWIPPREKAAAEKVTTDQAGSCLACTMTTAEPSPPIW